MRVTLFYVAVPACFTPFPAVISSFYQGDNQSKTTRHKCLGLLGLQDDNDERQINIKKKLKIN
ncbi:hypothetical protein [Photobacterium lucens]|uniref:hypothetical protein n=1 Tax=Photobacterium lucens TaxID=2562949 RepID=UPI00136D3F4B|nr:hypothetical protein [Photobacterium lucens]MBP2701005.1 hypothetical protein [Vibrio parahaemolyticus]MZG58696.1 hypothetical protein [Photobacterium lucens]MZG79347.1 hypothetical protein [Photobacterium lucens]